LTILLARTVPPVAGHGTGAEKLAMIERGVRGRAAFAANKFASIFIA
jgi:hypothetical protein